MKTLVYLELKIGGDMIKNIKTILGEHKPRHCLKSCTCKCT